MSVEDTGGPPPTTGPPVRRRATCHEVAMGFVAWMRDEEFVGWLLASDIPDALGWYCELEKLEAPPIDMFRAALGKAPGVTAERRRLAHATDVVLRALRRRAKSNRPELYHIASHDQMAAAARAEREIEATRHAKPPTARPKAAAKPAPKAAAKVRRGRPATADLFGAGELSLAA